MTSSTSQSKTNHVINSITLLEKVVGAGSATRLNGGNYILTKARIGIGVMRDAATLSMLFSSQCALSDTYPRTRGQCEER